MSNFKIIGPSNPEVGKEIIYKTSNSDLSISLPGQIKTVENNPFTEQVKWSIYILEYGKWVLKEKNNKTGLTANYTFTEKSLKRQGIRIMALFGNEKATLDIKPQHSIERKIVKVELCDALGNLQTKPFAYNQTVLVRVHCLNLDNCTVHVTLWEDDAPGTGHSKINKNNKAITKSELISNGIADVKFKLAPDFAKMADAQVAKGDKSEGKMHEYYVTAEVFRQKTKSSNNINVINPNDKVADIKATPQKPASKKPATKPAKAKPAGPAAKKAPSKKQEKKIPEPASGTLYDWGESVLKAMSITLPDPVEIVNSIAKVFAPDKKDEKGVSCGEKYCIKKGDKSELIREVNIRLAGFGGNVPTDEFTDRTEKMIKQFQRDYMKVPETGKICGNVLRAIDDFSSKFDLSQAVWSSLDCSCTTKGRNATSSLKGINELNNCKGWGDGTGKGTYKTGNAEKDHKYEYPGIHRSLLFGFKATLFYLSKHSTYKFWQISSGYRCRFKNYVTTNHQGKAIDIQFKDTGNIGGALQENIPKLKKIREDIFYKYLNSKTSWINGTNNFCLEPIALIYKLNGEIDKNYTYSWIHFDVREFEPIYLEDKYFCKNKDGLNGINIIQLAKKYGLENICNCFSNEEGKKNVNSESSFIGNCEDKFKKVAPIILEHEGGYKNEPSKDKGDPTNKGISWPVWVKYAKSDLNIEPTVDNQKNLTSEQATIIYRKRYWEPKGYCEIEDLKIALMVYDWSITSGGAIKEIQKLLVNEYSQTITIDGGMGKKTANAINEAAKKGDLLNKIAEIRRKYYKKGADEGWFSDDYSKGLDKRVTKCLNYEL